jgi:hypothetical protein
MRLLGYVLGLLALLSISACGIFSERGGERYFLETDIEFKGQDGKALSGATAYIGERIGSNMIATSVAKTDSRGHIRIKGFRCLPLVVAVNGGSAVINNSKSAMPYYSVVAKISGAPAANLFGEPDLKYVGYADTHEDCD